MSPTEAVITPHALERLSASLAYLDTGMMIKEPGDWFELLK